MAELERRTAAAPALEKRTAGAPVPQSQSDVESLPALFGRLGDDVMTLLDTKLSLAKVEIKEEMAVYTRGGAMIGVGAVLASIGFVLLNVAIAFLISTLFTFDRQPLNYAFGFIITGVLYLVIGGILVMVMKNRLAAQPLVPDRSIEELRKDKQWLKNEI